MADNPEFYQARAAEERANADAATLDNVRDRCERAEKAWLAMANRATRTQTLRTDREAAAAQRAADVASDGVPDPINRSVMIG